MAISACVLAALLSLEGVQAALFELSGTVADASGPLPGATVVARGEAGDRKAITDERGRYEIRNLPAGTYSVSAGIAASRIGTRDLTLHASMTADFTLRPAPLATVDWVVPAPADAYRQADAIAHVRIEATASPAGCGAVVLAAHEATVIAALKGTLPPRIRLLQYGAGTCDEGGHRVSGNTRTHQAGEQYLILLRREEAGFSSLAGPSLTFPVSNGVAHTSGFAGLPEVMATADFVAALKNLTR